MAEKQVMREHMKERLGGKAGFNLHPDLPECLNIEVNNTCNQKCVFCPYHGLYTPKEINPAVLEVEFVKKIMKQAAELGIGRKEIGFYLAGEPLLYNGMADVISYAKELGFDYVFMTTNGALATPERLNPIIDAGLDSIRFSINAADRERYREIHGRDDFDAVVSNVKAMCEYIRSNNIKLATSVSCVITKKTIDITHDMRELFGKYVDDMMFIPVMLERLSNMEETKEKYEVIDDSDVVFNLEFICPLLFNTMYINALGKVVPCCNAYDDDTYFADLKVNDDLLAAWESEGYLKFRSIFLGGESDEGTICENCLMRRKTVKRFMYDE